MLPHASEASVAQTLLYAHVTMPHALRGNMSEAIALPPQSNVTNVTRPGLTPADVALLYNGASMLCLCLLSYGLLYLLIRFAPRLRDVCLAPRRGTVAWAAGSYWWQWQFWWPDNDVDDADIVSGKLEQMTSVLLQRSGVEAAMLMGARAALFAAALGRA